MPWLGGADTPIWAHGQVLRSMMVGRSTRTIEILGQNPDTGKMQLCQFTFSSQCPTSALHTCFLCNQVAESCLHTLDFPGCMRSVGLLSEEDYLQLASTFGNQHKLLVFPMAHSHNLPQHSQQQRRQQGSKCEEKNVCTLFYRIGQAVLVELPMSRSYQCLYFFIILTQFSEVST